MGWLPYRPIIVLGRFRGTHLKPCWGHVGSQQLQQRHHHRVGALVAGVACLVFVARVSLGGVGVCRVGGGDLVACGKSGGSDLGQT